jgi:hypothetical protein
MDAIVTSRCRSVRQVSASFLEAPWGCAVIVFMYATGISSLRAYDAELTARALELYEQTAAGGWSGESLPVP